LPDGKDNSGATRHVMLCYAPPAISAKYFDRSTLDQRIRRDFVSRGKPRRFPL
jgi:hypothetical protein